MKYTFLRKTFFYLVILLAISIIIYVPLSIKNRKKSLAAYEESYWNQTNIEFCGIVLKKEMIDHGFGYVCLERTKSNIKGDFELFINKKVFVCQLKADKILYVANLVDLNIGDSLCYNIGGNKKEIRYRNGEKLIEFENRIIVETNIKYSPTLFSCE